MKMDKAVVLFTMQGCPFCEEFKKLLDENNIEVEERDIHEHDEEYDNFVEIVGNDYVPAFMLIKDLDKEKPIPSFFAPERDYNDLTEAFNIINKFLD